MPMLIPKTERLETTSRIPEGLRLVINNPAEAVTKPEPISNPVKVKHERETEPELSSAIDIVKNTKKHCSVNLGSTVRFPSPKEFPSHSLPISTGENETTQYPVSLFSNGTSFAYFFVSIIVLTMLNIICIKSNVPINVRWQK